ncbi:MAG: NAD(P)/FAD-dependent oxidoreductase [Chloroflexi bacterium]|nr:NAD(P)/FAD-dependent oxidoreductase [Chloroflexota bacterium]OJW04365.1 MAG: hypothetical protein BGO39_11435 [Chloroflexi bacterium 54-19]
MSAYNNSKPGAVIVVGGGLAGLAAATYLARAGWTTTLYEKAHTTGGRALTNVIGDFRFNMGPHALYCSGPAEQILRELGVSYSGKKPKIKAEVFYQGEVYTPQGGFTPLFNPRWLGLRDFPGLIKFLARLFTVNPAKLAHLSVEEWLNQTKLSEAARQTLYALDRVATYTNAPELQSADTFVIQLKHVLKTGVRYLDGGWQTLVNNLRQAALDAGVKIVAGKRVAEVVGDGRVEGVRLVSGEFIPAVAVVLAAEPQEAAQLVDNTALKTWAKAVQPARAACLDIALKELPYPDRTFVPGIDVPLYYSVHSAYAKLGPAGTTVLHVAKYLRPDETTVAKDDERELEAFMDKVQPGWRDEVLEKRFLPHMTVINAFPRADQGGLAGRFGPTVPGFANLYLAGDWVGPEGLLLDSVLSSARRAARLINDPATQPQEIEVQRGKQPVGSL